MTIGIIGESCVGKSTLAKELNELIKGKIYTGKDYLRLSKNEQDAKVLFRKVLNESNCIYVITEKEHLELLPDSAFRILITCDIDTIKKRFLNRIGNGKLKELPKPINQMLENKHHMFDNEFHNILINNNQYDINTIYKDILDYE